MGANGAQAVAVNRIDRGATGCDACVGLVLVQKGLIHLRIVVVILWTGSTVSARRAASAHAKFQLEGRHRFDWYLFDGDIEDN